jgi:glycosyltransferase involved in cell wall biosynthesis
VRGKRIIFAVFDELHREYRGYKTALTFKKAGYSVKVIGIRYNIDKLSGWEDIPHRRISLNKKVPLILNMLVFWLRLLHKLLKEKCDIIYSHDIFPLLPVYIVSKLKKVPYIYDAHEFWHGNSQVENRPAAKKFWTSYERFFIKRAKSIITVSVPIAEELENIYGLKNVRVLTNLPIKKEIPQNRTMIHDMLGLEKDTKIVMYQGSFLINNGLDDIIRAFAGVEKKAVLVLAGSGSEKDSLVRLTEETGLSDRVFFIGPFSHAELIRYTVCADIGLCLIRNSGKSYYYSAPNKMFEFIQAGVPQIASDFPEMKKYVSGMNTGINIDPSDKDKITKSINMLINDVSLYKTLKDSCIKNGPELVWETIENILTESAL